jgi:probable rRNA maturation factor
VPSINFYTADKGYSIKNKNKIKDWIQSEAAINKKQIEEINIVFCSDDYLLDLNKKFLNHNYYTDVITFDNSIENNISGEIYISVDRLRENAKNLNAKLFDEFIRIIIHGSLHLFGFSDKSKREKELMTQKENEAIDRFYSLQ